MPVNSKYALQAACSPVNSGVFQWSQCCAKKDGKIIFYKRAPQADTPSIKATRAPRSNTHTQTKDGGKVKKHPRSNAPIDPRVKAKRLHHPRTSPPKKTQQNKCKPLPGITYLPPGTRQGFIRHGGYLNDKPLLFNFASHWLALPSMLSRVHRFAAFWRRELVLPLNTDSDWSYAPIDLVLLVQEIRD